MGNQWGQTRLILEKSFDFVSPPRPFGDACLLTCSLIRSIKYSLPRTHALLVAVRISSIILSGTEYLNNTWHVKHLSPGNLPIR